MLNYAKDLLSQFRPGGSHAVTQQKRATKKSSKNFMVNRRIAASHDTKPNKLSLRAQNQQPNHTGESSPGFAANNHHETSRSSISVHSNAKQKSHAVSANNARLLAEQQQNKARQRRQQTASSSSFSDSDTANNHYSSSNTASGNAGQQAVSGSSTSLLNASNRDKEYDAFKQQQRRTDAVAEGSELWYPDYRTAIKVLLSARLCSVFWNGINDCDEVYNYWEPTHFLVYGKGFQTWEYSPQYAIRSYAYLLLQIIPAQLYSSAVDANKLFVFYIIRLLMAVVCAVAETTFYHAILTKYGAHVARLMFLFLIFSPGMYTASTAYLPSSFAMYMVTLGHALYLLNRTTAAVTCIALATILGWPFTAVLGLPVAVAIIFRTHEAKPITRVLQSNGRVERINDTVYAKSWFSGVAEFAVKSFIIGAMISYAVITIDKIMYGRNVFPTLNIVLYNVFNSAAARAVNSTTATDAVGSSGANLYGTEPWYFYALNLMLNFNIVMVFAALSALLIVLAYADIVPSPVLNVFGPFRWSLSITGDTAAATAAASGGRITARRVRWLRFLDSFSFLITPFIWLGIFVAQQHKEERFLFPIYPHICFLAAMGADLSQRLVARVTKKQLASYLSYTSWILTVILVAFTVISTSRIVALYKNHHKAPIDTYMSLYSPEIGGREELRALAHASDADGDGGVNVCVGKEWHRFPSHFFLPPNYTLRFIKSEFAGQLPRLYAGVHNGSIANATRIIQPGFNDLNREDATQYFSGGIAQCHLLVDFEVVDVESPLEPRYSRDTRTWSISHSTRFMDAARSPRFIRSFYIPFYSSTTNRYGEYVLLWNNRLLGPFNTSAADVSANHNAFSDSSYYRSEKMDDAESLPVVKSTTSAPPDVAATPAHVILPTPPTIFTEHDDAKYQEPAVSSPPPSIEL